MFSFPIIIASLSTFIAIVLLRPFALSINLTDKPSNRKFHTGSVPLIGGIAMFFGMAISILMLPLDLNDYNFFFLSSIIIVSIGVLDDHRDISVELRLLFQALVAIIIISGGNLSILSFGNLFGAGEILLNGWAYFVTFLAIIAAINALNMADGIHGLAGGNSLVTFASILFLSISKVSYQDLWIPLIFCSILPVFLIYNLCLGVSKNKRIFMGDAGSMFLGMSIIWLLLDFSQGNFLVFQPVTALWLFAIPLIDMFTVFIRRILSGKSPFNADVFHMHHLLLHLGIKQINVLLIILLFSIFMALIGILGELYEVTTWVMFYGFLSIFVVYLFWNRRTIKKIKNNTELSV